MFFFGGGGGGGQSKKLAELVQPLNRIKLNKPYTSLPKPAAVEAPQASA